MADEPTENAGPQEAEAAPAPPEKPNPIEAKLKAAFGDAVSTRYNAQGELEARVAFPRLTEVCGALLRDRETPYDYLRNLTAVDWKDRFELVYHVCCTATMMTVAVKCDVDRAAPIANTMTGLWSGANWLEREVYDLFGIEFAGHPDLRRIMLPDTWEGHPLRKDYVMPEEREGQ